MYYVTPKFVTLRKCRTDGCRAQTSNDFCKKCSDKIVNDCGSELALLTLDDIVRAVSEDEQDARP